MTKPTVVAVNLDAVHEFMDFANEHRKAIGEEISDFLVREEVLAYALDRVMEAFEHEGVSVDDARGHAQAHRLTKVTMLLMLSEAYARFKLGHGQKETFG